MTKRSGATKAISLISLSVIFSTVALAQSENASTPDPKILEFIGLNADSKFVVAPKIEKAQNRVDFSWNYQSPLTMSVFVKAHLKNGAVEKEFPISTSEINWKTTQIGDSHRLESPPEVDPLTVTGAEIADAISKTLNGEEIERLSNVKVRFGVDPKTTYASDFSLNFHDGYNHSGIDTNAYLAKGGEYDNFTGFDLSIYPRPPNRRKGDPSFTSFNIFHRSSFLKSTTVMGDIGVKVVYPNEYFDVVVRSFAEGSSPLTRNGKTGLASDDKIFVTNDVKGPTKDYEFYSALQIGEEIVPLKGASHEANYFLSGAQINKAVGELIERVPSLSTKKIYIRSVCEQDEIFNDFSSDCVEELTEPEQSENRRVKKSETFYKWYWLVADDGTEKLSSTNHEIIRAGSTGRANANLLKADDY